MKKRLYLIAMLSFSMLFVGCSDTTEETVTDEGEDICYFTYDKESSDLTWTAYKTSAKVGVKGSFNDITVTGMETSDDPKAMIESLEFKINTSSVETNDNARNLTISTSFFDKMKGAGTISGKVKSLGENGRASIEISMNEVTSVVEGDYTLESGKFTFTSTVDVSLWSAMDALSSLNEVCKDKHTGDDGISKTWSEVELSFTTQLKSDCDSK